MSQRTYEENEPMKKVRFIKLQRGFTIVEILAVMIVFIVIGSIAAAVFFTSLRTVNKSNSLASLRENGNYALSQVVKMIRYAQKFEGVSADGLTYIPECTASSGVQDVPVPYLKIRGFDNQPTVLQCSTGVNGNIASNSSSLLDPSVVKTVNACSFSCYQKNSGDHPTITVTLTISETSSASAPGIIERNTTLPLQTSVTFRN